MNDNRKNKIVGITIVGISTVLFILSIIYLIDGMNNNKKYNKVEGTIHNPECRRVDTSDDYYYICDFTIQYQYNNKLFTQEIKKEKTSIEYNENREIEVFINKENEEEYTLNSPESLIAISIGVLALSIVLAIIGIKTIVTKKENKVQTRRPNRDNRPHKEPFEINNEYQDQDGITAEMYWPLMGRTVEIWTEKEVDHDYLVTVVEDIKKITQDSEIFKDFIKRTRDYSNSKLVEQPDWKEEDNYIEDINENNYKDYLKCDGIYIQDRHENDICYAVQFSCPWQPEHRMSWTILNGKNYYIGFSNVYMRFYDHICDEIQGRFYGSANWPLFMQSISIEGKGLEKDVIKYCLDDMKKITEDSMRFKEFIEKTNEYINLPENEKWKKEIEEEITLENYKNIMEPSYIYIHSKEEYCIIMTVAYNNVAWKVLNGKADKVGTVVELVYGEVEKHE